MTHLYTILTSGVVLPGGDAAACTAIAWAVDTVLALGSDSEVLSMSRGDSDVVSLDGRLVVPAVDRGVLEVGGPADFAVLAAGARAGAPVVALVRGGRLVAGGLPGLVEHEQGDGHAEGHGHAAEDP